MQRTRHNVRFVGNGVANMYVRSHFLRRSPTDHFSAADGDLPMNLHHYYTKQGVEWCRQIFKGYRFVKFDAQQIGPRVHCAVFLQYERYGDWQNSEWTCADAAHALEWYNLFAAVFGEPEKFDFFKFGADGDEDSTTGASF